MPAIEKGQAYIEKCMKMPRKRSPYTARHENATIRDENATTECCAASPVHSERCRDRKKKKKKRERERERLIIEKKIVKDNVVKGLQQTSQHGVTSWVLE